MFGFSVKPTAPSAKRKKIISYFKVIRKIYKRIGHFTAVDLVPWPLSECETDGDLVLIQTSIALLWKLSLKNTS